MPKTFLDALKGYALGGDTTPPALDLSSLIEPGTDVDVHSLVSGKVHFWPIRQGLVEDVDFIYVAADGWDALTKWYKYPDTAPALPRRCLADGRIEIAPNGYRLHVATSALSVPVPPAAPAAPLIITAPSSTTTQKLREFIRTIVGDRQALGTPLRLFTLDQSDDIETLEVDIKDMPKITARLLKNDTLHQLGMCNGDAIIVEFATLAGNNYAVHTEADGLAIDKPAAPAPLFAKPAFYSGNGTPAEAATSNNLLALANAKPQTRAMTRGSKGRGLVGLNNLGNTCFLASATQCLSNTQVLADYFLCTSFLCVFVEFKANLLRAAGVYQEELNPDNPLGMHGQVAEAFGEVVETLWNSQPHSSYSPRRLKTTCSRFAPQFAGYGQHDTQEFLAFLLDGLHEDLNRIKKKPYIEKPDWVPGGGDKELAELGKECWEGYKKRNDSVIVDLFQGQLQSTLVCPECHKESITLDPFMYLTVPLPISQTRTFKLIFFPKDVEKPPVNVHLLVPANASFQALKDKLGKLVGAPGGNIIGFDLWKGSIYSWWLDSDPNSEAKDSDVAVFHELAAPVTATHKAVCTVATDGSVTVPVYTFSPHEQPRSSYQRDTTPNECNLEPFFITLSRAEATDPAAVRMAIVKGYSRLVKPEKKSALFVPAGNPEAMEVEEEEEEEVADIHIDESSPAAEPSVSHLAPPSPATATATATPAIAAIQRNSSSHSLSSQSGHPLVAAGGLFKVHVADASSTDNTGGMFSSFRKSDPNEHNIWKGTPQRASSSWSSLDKRGRAKRHVLQRIGSSISSLVGSAANSDDEGGDHETTPAAAAIIRPGEAIFVEWPQASFGEFFVTQRDSLIRNLDLVIDPAIAKDAAKKREGRSISLDDCLDEFSKEETLGQDDLWYCPQCKKHQAATKKLDIYKAPDILVICIKRFGSSRTMRDKLDHMVNFPIDGLDLDERVGERRVTKTLNLTDEEAHHYGIEHSTEPFIYDLYAVDNHFGGLGGGHYTAFCRNAEDNHWYNYDDSRVSKASEESVQSRAAYLLFYRRRTERRIGGISRIKAEEASRAATPQPSVPASPVIGPSVPASAMASAVASFPGTPSQPSPTLSSNSSLASSSPRQSPADLASAGAAVGFGNTAWGSGNTSISPVKHNFGASLPTPDSSDDEFVPIQSTGTTASVVESVPTSLAASATTASTSTGANETGLGEEYAVIRSDTSDAEMVSVPRSPQSEEGA